MEIVIDEQMDDITGTITHFPSDWKDVIVIFFLLATHKKLALSSEILGPIMN